MVLRSSNDENGLADDARVVGLVLGLGCGFAARTTISSARFLRERVLPAGGGVVLSSHPCVLGAFVTSGLGLGLGCGVVTPLRFLRAGETVGSLRFVFFRVSEELGALSNNTV